ncbi:VOC family protein [Streptomyces sp. NBC_01262]|jgi:predicted enzyme related to lactoylglutathione lyase|uniref:VOC family protein n=1 Tax=Streptomyces sp. NBC_01262 TaxID=2903803 RepID=UPI002E3687AF|nr:VOC family protein [Streptomyces sp. NBC_01262]
MSEQSARPASAVVHFDISGPNDEELHRFYGDLLDWRIDRKGPGYALVQTPGGLGGAIVDSEHASVTLGVTVPDLAQAVAHAGKLGAVVVMPPTDNGWVTKAQIKDPAGNVLTLIQA